MTICQDSSCNKVASFGTDKPLYCASHKTVGMINKTHKKCETDKCTILARFGLDGKATHCVSHKHKDAIDVVSKRCLYYGCLKNPSFAYTKGQKQYCATHRLPNMINVRSKLCSIPKCDKCRMYQSTLDSSQFFCSTHKPTHAILIKNKCIFTSCNTQASFGYKKKGCNSYKISYQLIPKKKLIKKLTIHVL